MRSREHCFNSLGCYLGEANSRRFTTLRACVVLSKNGEGGNIRRLNIWLTTVRTHKDVQRQLPKREDGMDCHSAVGKVGKKLNSPCYYIYAAHVARNCGNVRYV